MFRAIASGVFALLLFGFPHSAQATTLTGCAACDGDLFAITFHLDSDDGTNSIFDVTLLADTSGNNIGGTLHINAVAVGMPKGVTIVEMDAAPNGAANWTPSFNGLSSGGCNDSSGSFICAQANSNTFAAVVPHTGIYEWTWDVSIPDSTQGGAASVFSSQEDVKLNYSDVSGHHVSDLFTFTDAPPPSERLPSVPEPLTSALVGAGLVSLYFLRRRAAR